MSESEETVKRRSERVIKRKKTYSPEPKDVKSEERVKRKKSGGQKKPFGRTLPNRPYDVLPSGEPFSCSLCKSGFVGIPVKKSKKGEKSRHVPLPKIRTDASGVDMLLCNPCGQVFDTSKERPKSQKSVQVPTEEDQQKYLQEATEFVNALKKDHDDPLVDRLFCPVSKKKLCGCVQKYFKSKGCENETESTIKDLLSLMKEAESLRKEKSYNWTESNKMKKCIGLGNGHKKSKAFEEFVLCKRRLLRDSMQLCERAAQRILMYSNNFLHKKLKTENRPCRIERTRGKAVLGQLPALDTLMEVSCCSDNCVMMALTHRKLLQSWRDRAQQGQMEARRVLAEMLTPVGASHTNCNQFIVMITGCSPSTIKRVSDQMVNTHGDRNPPEHGMKKVWQENYRLNKRICKPAPEVTSDCDTESVASSTAQPAVSTRTETNSHIVVTDSNIMFELQRQHLMKMQQDIEQKQQLLQQQQVSLQLQLLAQQASAARDQPQQLQLLAQQVSTARDQPQQLQLLAQQVSTARDQPQQTIEFQQFVPQAAQTSPHCAGLEVLQMQLPHPQQSPIIDCHSGTVVNQSVQQISQLQPIMIQQQPLHQHNRNQSTCETGNQPQVSLPAQLLPVAVNQQSQSEGTNQISNVQEIVLSPFEIVQTNAQQNQPNFVIQQMVPQSESHMVQNQCIQIQLVPTQDNQTGSGNLFVQKQGSTNEVVLQPVGNSPTLVPLNVQQVNQMNSVHVLSPKSPYSHSPKSVQTDSLQVSLNDSTTACPSMHLQNYQVVSSSPATSVVTIPEHQIQMHMVSVDDQCKMQVAVQRNEYVQESPKISMVTEQDNSQVVGSVSGVSPYSVSTHMPLHYGQSLQPKTNLPSEAVSVSSDNTEIVSSMQGEVLSPRVDENGPSQLHLSVVNSANLNGQLTNQLLLSNGRAFNVPICTSAESAKPSLGMSTQEHSSSKIHKQATDKSEKVQQLNGGVGKFQQTDKPQKIHESSAKSRQASGNSVKSRHSSGNGAVRSRQSSGNSLSSECFRQFSWIFKQNDRSRQPSGNSQVADRSRRSSGNSLLDQSVLSNVSPSFFLLQQDGDFDSNDNFPGNLNISDQSSFGNLIFNLTPVPDLQSPLESQSFVVMDDDHITTEHSIGGHVESTTGTFDRKIVPDEKISEHSRSITNQTFSKTNKVMQGAALSVRNHESEEGQVSGSASDHPVFSSNTALTMDASQCYPNNQKMGVLKSILSRPSKYADTQDSCD